VTSLKSVTFITEPTQEESISLKRVCSVAEKGRLEELSRENELRLKMKNAKSLAETIKADNLLLGDQVQPSLPLSLSPIFDLCKMSMFVLASSLPKPDLCSMEGI